MLELFFVWGFVKIILGIANAMWYIEFVEFLCEKEEHAQEKVITGSYNERLLYVWSGYGG